MWVSGQNISVSVKSYVPLKGSPVACEPRRTASSQSNSVHYPPAPAVFGTSRWSYVVS